MRCSAAVIAMMASVVVTACGPGGRSGTAQVSARPVTAQPTASAAGAAAPGGAGTATRLDPCQLVTRAEASSLAGTSFGPGREESDGKNGEKRCIYGYQTMNVFMVEAAQATSAAAARANWARAKAKAQAALAHKLPPGIKVSMSLSDVPGLGDRAATVYGSTTVAGQTVGLSGIYLLKGATFLAFQDLLAGHAPPSTADLKAEARKALARVP